MWHGGLKAKWSASLFDAQDEIDREISSVTLPFITLHGTGDTLVDIESSRFLNNRAQSEDKTFEASTLTALLEYLRKYRFCSIDYTIYYSV